MRNRRILCAALSALWVWNGATALAGENELLLIEEEEDHICAAAVELGMAPLQAENKLTAAEKAEESKTDAAREAREPEENVSTAGKSNATDVTGDLKAGGATSGKPDTTEAAGTLEADTIASGMPGATEDAEGTEADAPVSKEPSMAWFEEKGLTLGESRLAYPALKEGVASEELRILINDRILEDGHFRDYVTRISQLISGGKLNVSWRGTLLGPVFALTAFADGAVETPRNMWVWTGGNIDLRDGHEVALEELVTDPEAAMQAMEEYLEYEVSPELSAHLLNNQLTPLPEVFVLSERGIIWKYDANQLSTLSDRAGDVLIPWQVIRPWLNRTEDSILRAMGLDAWIVPWTEETDPEQAALEVELLQAMTARGAIPGIPARLGDSMLDLTEDWRMLIDPDVYALGRFFSLEGATFRGVFLMTDFLSEGWENSIVDGIRTDMGSIYGLSIGETTQAAWRKILGEPDHTVLFDAEQAEAYRTVPGSRDYYEFGGHRLQLHADDAGTLVSVILSE